MSMFSKLPSRFLNGCGALRLSSLGTCCLKNALLTPLSHLVFVDWRELMVLTASHCDCTVLSWWGHVLSMTCDALKCFWNWTGSVRSKVAFGFRLIGSGADTTNCFTLADDRARLSYLQSNLSAWSLLSWHPTHIYLPRRLCFIQIVCSPQSQSRRVTQMMSTEELLLNALIVGALVTWAIYTQGQLLLWSSLIITGVVPGYK